MSVYPFATVIRILEEGWYTDQELALWLQSPQPMHDGQTPIEMLAEGRKSQLLGSVQALEEGTYI